jgi:hypothetical protein
MRLFRKTVTKAEKGKKTKNETENQYEYVRKEFGFDDVPPSQYVPSQSLSEDDDDYVGNGNIDDDAETIELQYQGAAPVKIIQPRSDLSASIAQEDDDLSLPEKSNKINRRIPGGKKNKLVIPQQKNKNAYRSRRETLPIPEEEDEEEEEYGNGSIIYPEDRHYHLNLRHRDQSHRVLPVSPRRSREKEVFRAQSPNRHKPEHHVSRDDIFHEHNGRDTIRRRSYHRRDEVDDLDDLDIGIVHTAFSYNSDDSAQSLVEERSRGSRYNTGKYQSSHRPTHQRRPRDVNHFQDTDLDDRVVVRTGSRKKTQKGWEFDGDNFDSAVRGRHARLEEYEKPRYDRKRSTRRETHHDFPVDYRKNHRTGEDEEREDDRGYSKKSLEVAYRSRHG